MDNSVSIIGYGAYIPLYRIKKEEYEKVWGFFSGKIKEKSVIGYDEDVITMAVEAAQNAIKNSEIDKNKISLIAVGSTSPPYTVKSMATEIAMALGIPLNILLLDFTESEKAGTTALISGIEIIKSKGGYGLIIGSDAPRAKPGDNIEHVQSAGAAAIIIGLEKNCIAEITDYYTYNFEYIPERFKKDGSTTFKDLDIAPYSNYAYNKAINGSVKGLLNKINMKIDDFNHIFIQGHDARQPTRVIPNIDKNKIYTEIINIIGDCGAALTLLGLVGIFHYKANKNDKILITSYASGAGSDAFAINMIRKQEKKEFVPTIEQYIERKEYIDYEKYLKFKELIELE